jgi:hypothetical protein
VLAEGCEPSLFLVHLVKCFEVVAGFEIFPPDFTYSHHLFINAILVDRAFIESEESAEKEKNLDLGSVVAPALFSRKTPFLPLVLFEVSVAISKHFFSQFFDLYR